MNCLHHHKVYAARPRTYRDLPLRLAEFGDVYRYEKHGSLSGMQRVRAMCQNDAHIYCEPLDFLMAERFGLTYRSPDNTLQRPYIIHRAPLGTHERTISFLVEMYGGAFPTWLAPVQLCLLPIGPDCAGYAREIEHQLAARMHRVTVDESSETFNKRVRTAVTRKIPNIWVAGKEEITSRTVTWRRYCTKEQLKMPVERAMDALNQLIRTRRMDNFADQTREFSGEDDQRY
jgi:threonyl-tRNA synthetase